MGSQGEATNGSSRDDPTQAGTEPCTHSQRWCSSPLAAVRATDIAQTYPPYQEPWRPQFHYSQPNLFMNDPNGLVYYAGEWHLFYQSRPGGGIVWGHAVSKDLVHWDNLPVAIPRQADGKSIYSGSVVVDKDNTSGFGTPGNPAMVAIYTAAGPGSQSQAVAYSLDKGRTFTFYSGNPVIDIKSAQFRDPKVFWHERAKRWVMVVAMPDDHQVAIYGSSDLKNWGLLSKWGPLPPVGGQYQVPDLFPLNVDGNPSRQKWVMIISTNPGGLWGGSQTAAYLGDFDGTTFKEDARYAYDGPPGTTMFADFEDAGYGAWTSTGTAFGEGPAQGVMSGQPLVNGFKGQRLLSSFNGGGASVGTMTSPTFTIDRRYINFLVGGTGAATAGGGRGRGVAAAEPAAPPGPTTVNLIVDGAIREGRHRELDGIRSIGWRGMSRISRGRRARFVSWTRTRPQTAGFSWTPLASLTRRRSPASLARRGSTGGRTTTPASHSTTRPTGDGSSSAG